MQFTQTEKYLIDKYQSLRLGVEQLSQEFMMTPKSITNAISAGRFPIHTYKFGKFRVADVRDVADYLDGHCKRLSVNQPRPASLSASR